MENNNYITKEFYDANMAEFRETVKEMIRAADARCESTLSQMRAEAAELKLDFQAKSDEMRENYKVVTVRLDNIDKRIDNIERSIDSLFTKLSLVFTGLTLIFTTIQYFLR